MKVGASTAQAWASGSTGDTRTGDRRETHNHQLKAREGLSWVLPLIVLVGVVARTAVAFNGGVWADEGLVLNIIAIPSWSEMLQFLQHNESHPPLFYLLCKLWMKIAGGGDRSMLALSIILGAAVIPATYFVGRSLFSRNVGVIAALFVSVSPSLVEHSSQLRPYGLLPALVLLSCALLIKSVEQGGVVRWTGYAVSTVLLLYTHNWTWLVVAAEAAVLGARATSASKDVRVRMLKGFAFATLVIAVLYAPWVNTLLYQFAHTGHTSLRIDGVAGHVAFVAVGALSLPFLLFFATYPSELLGLVSIAAAATAAGLIIGNAAPRVRTLFRAMLDRSNDAVLGNRESQRAAFLVLLWVPALALTAALVMSPRSNLALERCMVMLTPLLLIGLSAWICRSISPGTPAARTRVLAGALLFFTLLLSTMGSLVLGPTTRSNAREVAEIVRANMRPSDLMILAPEWYASSFNRYFPASIEQVDYPHTGRTRLLSFSDVRTRTVDSSALADVRLRIARARADGRRVWLISEKRYIEYIDEVLPNLTTEEDRNRYPSVLRVKEIRDALDSSYGLPDTTHYFNRKVSRYEEILPLLFAPQTRLPAKGF